MMPSRLMRSLNTDCDSLAVKAKTLTEHNLLLDLKVVQILGLNIVAKWDGGYTAGESFVTVGFSIDTWLDREDSF